MEKLTARRVQPLVGVRAEIIALRLQQIRRQAVGGVAVEVTQRRSHGRSRNAVRDSRSCDLAPRGDELLHGFLEIRVEQEVTKLRIFVIRFLDLAEEDRPDDAAAAPHEGNAAIVEIPAVGLRRRAHEGVALRVGDDLGRIQRLPDGFDRFCLVASERRDRAGIFLGCLDALVFHGGQAARKHGFADERQRNALIQRRNARPLAGALLPGGIENLLDDGLSISVLVGKDIAGNLDQIAVKLRLVPRGKDLVHFIIAHTEQIAHELIGFAD